MKDNEKIGALLEFGQLDMKIGNLNAGLKQEIPWGKAFSLKDLKLLSNHEIKEEDNPYVKKGLDFGGESFSFEDLNLDRLAARSKDMGIRLEDPSGRVYFRSEDQSMDVKNLNISDLEVSLTEFSVEELIIKKLIGCDFGMKMFPFHTGIRNVQEAEIIAKGVTIGLEFENDVSGALDAITGNLGLDVLDVDSKDLSLEDLDIEGGKLNLRDLGSNSEDVSVTVEDFELDLENLCLGLGTLRLENTYPNLKNVALTDVKLNFGKLIGKLKDLIEGGLDFLSQKMS